MTYKKATAACNEIIGDLALTPEEAAKKLRQVAAYAVQGAVWLETRGETRLIRYPRPKAA